MRKYRTEAGNTKAMADELMWHRRQLGEGSYYGNFNPNPSIEVPALRKTVRFAEIEGQPAPHMPAIKNALVEELVMSMFWLAYNTDNDYYPSVTNKALLEDPELREAYAQVFRFPPGPANLGSDAPRLLLHTVASVPSSMRPNAPALTLRKGDTSGQGSENFFRRVKRSVEEVLPLPGRRFEYMPMDYNLPDFDSGPVKDARTRRTGQSRSKRSVRDQETEDALPNGVSMGQSGYARKGRR